MITCKEYNKRFTEMHLGFVVRYGLGCWAVCDGLAPDSDTLVDEKAVFIGEAVEWFHTYEEADKYRDWINSTARA